MVAAGFPKPAPHIYPIPSEIKRFITTHFLHPVAKLFPGACFSLLNAQTHIKKVIRPNRTNNFIIRGLPIYCTPLCSTIYYISYNITFFSFVNTVISTNIANIAICSENTALPSSPRGIRPIASSSISSAPFPPYLYRSPYYIFVYSEMPPAPSYDYAPSKVPWPAEYPAAPAHYA